MSLKFNFQSARKKVHAFFFEEKPRWNSFKQNNLCAAMAIFVDLLEQLQYKSCD